jgi:hypothetical protein
MCWKFTRALLAHQIFLSLEWLNLHSTVAVKSFETIIQYNICTILTKISDQSIEKQKSYAILNDRLETYSYRAPCNGTQHNFC